MKKYPLCCVLCTLLIGCVGEKTDKEIDETTIKCPCPPVVLLQPATDFSVSEAKELVPKLKTFVNEALGYELDVEVQPPFALHDSLKNEGKSRFRADKIIRATKKDPHNPIIILTHKDISCTNGDIPDYGVCGFSFIGHPVCVASDYRVKNRRQNFWKVAAHELSHSFFSLNHCAKDDPTCVVKDAYGKADFSAQNHLCNDCKGKIRMSI